MTAKEVVENSIKDVNFFAKYVSTESGYYFGPHFVNHSTLVPKGEKPITAGFINVLDGEICTITRDGSMTLKCYPDACLDVAGITEALGIPVKMAE